MCDPSDDANSFYFTRGQWFQIFLTIITVASTLLGVFIGGWQANEVYQQEQKNELKNIAQALYFDISGIEDVLNNSLNHSSSKPGFIHVLGYKYYDNNGLYYIFSKDISRFDSETSEDLYDFYGFILALENSQEDLLTVTKKRLDTGNVTDYDYVNAYEITRMLCSTMPDGIKKANKIKKELRQKYDVNITVPSTVIYNHPPKTYILEGGSVEFTS